MKRIINFYKIFFTIIGIIILPLQSLIFSIQPEEIKKIEYFEKEELLIDVNQLENKLRADENNYEIITKLGIEYHFLSNKYNQDVSGKNEEYLSKSLKIKKNPLIEAYFGISQMQKAKTTFNPLTKKEFVKTGLKIINNAVGSSPENFHIRLIRIKISLKNKLFGRISTAKEDIEYCEELYKNGKVNESDYPDLLYFKGLYFETINNKKSAKIIFQEIISKYPKTHSALLSKQALEN